MKKEQIITTIMLWIWLVMFCYGAILQDKAKAWNEIIEIQKELEQLNILEQEAKDRWHVAEESKTECIESWNEQQKKEQEHAEDIRAKKAELEDRLGLLLQSQLQ